MSEGTQFGRRQVITSALVGALGIAFLGGCGDDDNGGAKSTTGGTTGATTGGGGGGGGKELKIGLMTPLTGPQTQLGKDQSDGIKFFVSQHPTIAGRPVKLLIEDTASQPQQGLTVARKLVNNDKVDLIMGIVNSAVLQSAAPFILGEKKPLIVTNAGAEAFTDKPQPLGFRVSHSNGQANRALGWYANKKLGYQKVAVLTYDFVAGTEHAGAFKDVFTSLGGEIVQEQKAPLGTPDFGPYLSKVPTSGVDALYVFLSGADAVKFFEQARSFGVAGKLPIIGPGFTLDEIVLKAVKSAGDGFFGAIHYLSVVDNPENKAFASGYAAFAGRPPTVYAGDAYLGMEAIAAALEATSGSIEADPFGKALEAVKLASPRGPFRFDANHQAVFTVYFYTVENGAVKIVDQVDDVTQHWDPPRA